MNKWFEVCYNINDIDHIIKLKVLSDKNILNEIYKEIQDNIFADIVLKNIKKNLSLQQSLIFAGFNINISDSYEKMKTSIVPISNVELYNIVYYKEIIPCEGCDYESGNQNDHMSYNGCLANNIFNI